MNQTAPQLLVSSETQQDRAKPPSSLSVRESYMGRRWGNRQCLFWGPTELASHLILRPGLSSAI